MAGGSPEQGRSVVSRVTAILMAFRGGGTHTLSDIATVTGLPTSTTHRLVGELVARRILERTDSGYRVGLPLRMIGAGRPQQPPPIGRGLSLVSELAEATRTTVRIGVLRDIHLATATARPGHPPPTDFVPDPEPPHRSALGQALLAFSSPDVAAAEIAQSREARDQSPAEVDRLRRALSRTRLTRVALHRSATENRCTVAVPVFGPGGMVLAALEATVSDARTGLEPLRSALVVAAGSLSRELATALLHDSEADGPSTEHPGPESAAS